MDSIAAYAYSSAYPSGPVMAGSRIQDKRLSWYIVPSARGADAASGDPEKRRPRHRGCGKNITGSNTPWQRGIHYE
jgi:hypothetical protein